MSYKALLSAKANYSIMYNSFQTAMQSQPSAIPNEDEHSNEEEEEAEYENENGQEGSPHSADEQVSNSFSNFQLKRCRFAPRQDIELLREVENAEDKPYLHTGKASWEAWGKIAHILNQKQIFGPVLTLSALTCKLRFEFLLKNNGGHALKFNIKRGTPDEFRKRDEMIAQVAPLVPDRGADLDGLPNGRKRRGRPRKMRFSQRFSSAEDEEEDRSLIMDGGDMNGQNMLGASGSKRKPGRPRKIPETPGSFLDGAALADYLSNSRARTRASDIPSAVGLAPPQPFLHYMTQPTGLPEGSVVTMLAEYLKRHHETDLQFKREQMESHLREKSEERRLERERLEVQKAEIETRKAELVFQRQKFELEQQERQVQLEMMKSLLFKKS